MSLRKLAEEDLSLIIENERDFGWPVRVTNPEGETESFIGLSGDISQVIDPDTGDAVSGRLAHVSLRISTLNSKNFTIPKAIGDKDSKPWLMAFEDINLKPYTFKVCASDPDRTLGLVTCILEVYEGKVC